MPGHGSIHFWLTHALFKEHSELTTHSGLHIGGIPTKPERHVQTAWLFISLHCELGPQGEGWHGFVLGGGVAVFTIEIRDSF